LVLSLSAAAAAMLLITFVLFAVQTAFQQQHLIFAYLVPLAFIAIRHGSLPALAAAFASALCAAYFLYPPDFSFSITEPLHIAELGFFCALALAICQFVGGLADDERTRKRASSYR
jgi:K+-sensing histidine kinase KdpD